MNDSEKILLYWSGEADEALAREVEALLDSDESARRYLQELNGFEAVMTDPDVPSPRAGLLDEVLEEQSAPRRVIHFPKPFLAAAAALALAAVALSLLFRPDRNVVTPIVIKPPAAASELGKPKLSERLLSRSGAFADSHRRLGQSYRQRSRWAKLQTQPPTT